MSTSARAAADAASARSAEAAPERDHYADAGLQSERLYNWRIVTPFLDLVLPGVDYEEVGDLGVHLVGPPESDGSVFSVGFFSHPVAVYQLELIGTASGLAGLRTHIAEQIQHVEQRIEDGKDGGAAIWRIALEDVARENRAALQGQG